MLRRLKVYRLHPEFDKYQVLTYSNPADSKRIMNWFNGEPLAKRWLPLQVEVLRDKDHQGRPPSDFPNFGSGIPTLSPRALEVLADLLKDNGEVLPLSCTDGDYAVFNVTRVVDALDESRSKLERFKSSGRIMTVAQYAFYEDRVKRLSIFKVPQFPAGDVYVTDIFVDRVKSAGLTGFDFELLWVGEETMSLYGHTYPGQPC